MARIFFEDTARDYYFRSLKRKSGYSWTLLAKTLSVSSRHLQDWRKGKYSFPQILANKVKDKFNVDLPTKVVIKQDYSHIQQSAILGGIRRFAVYGSPATLEGRRKGGRNSARSRKRNPSGFKVAKIISIPSRTSLLAEFIGAMLGDGGISLWQIHISLNRKTDKHYALYLILLIERLFIIKACLYERQANSTLEVVVSSVKLIAFLRKNNLLVGNKIRQGLSIPKWIYMRTSWKRACLRGLFDTDGCTYIDYHSINGKTYAHIGLAFTSYSAPLLQDIYSVLQSLFYSPTRSTKNRILLRKEKEIYKFFKEIKPSNVRHTIVLKRFLEEYRSGYNGTASKAVFSLRETVGSNPTSSAYAILDGKSSNELE